MCQELMNKINLKKRRQEGKSSTIPGDTGMEDKMHQKIVIQSRDTPLWTPTRRDLPTPVWWALSTRSVKSSTFPSVSGYWKSTPLTSFPLKSISWGNFSSMRTPLYLERQKTKSNHAFGFQEKINLLQFIFSDIDCIHILRPSSLPPSPTSSWHTHTHPHLTPDLPMVMELHTTSSASNSLASVSFVHPYHSHAPSPARTCSWEGQEHGFLGLKNQFLKLQSSPHFHLGSVLGEWKTISKTKRKTFLNYPVPIICENTPSEGMVVWDWGILLNTDKKKANKHTGKWWLCCVDLITALNKYSTLAFIYIMPHLGFIWIPYNYVCSSTQ